MKKLIHKGVDSQIRHLYENTIDKNALDIFIVIIQYLHML